MFFNSEQSLLNQIQSTSGLLIDTIIALDEVGRGCVAGPVLTCASLWVKAPSNSEQKWVPEVKDSKKLTPAKRLACFNKVLKEFNYTENNIPFKNSHSIPKINILKPKTVFIMSAETINQSNNQFKCIGFCLGEGNIAEVEQFNIWNAVQIAASRALLGLK
jgi:hypothetical protein